MVLTITTWSDGLGKEQVSTQPVLNLRGRSSLKQHQQGSYCCQPGMSTTLYKLSRETRQLSAEIETEAQKRRN